MLILPKIIQNGVHVQGKVKRRKEQELARISNSSVLSQPNAAQDFNQTIRSFRNNRPLRQEHQHLLEPGNHTLLIRPPHPTCPCDPRQGPRVLTSKLPAQRRCRVTPSGLERDLHLEVPVPCDTPQGKRDNTLEQYLASILLGPIPSIAVERAGVVVTGRLVKVFTAPS